MRFVALIVTLLLTASPALAQEYAAQDNYVPQVAPQQQVSGNYYPQAPYPPQAQPAYNAPLQAQPTQPAQSHAPQPGDYGQSVTTDIRQMNF